MLRLAEHEKFYNLGTGMIPVLNERTDHFVAH